MQTFVATAQLTENDPGDSLSFWSLHAKGMRKG